MADANEFELDDTDRGIIEALLKDSRRAYTEIADELKVSSSTIHVRMDKLKKAGVVKGSRLEIDYSRVGYDVSAYLGINLRNARDYPKALDKLRNFPNILEAYYTTGQFNIFAKIIVRSISDLHKFLLELQQFREVQSTQTIMILHVPIDRELVP